MTKACMSPHAPHGSPETLTFQQRLLLAACKFTVKNRWRADLPSDLGIPEGQGAVLIANHRCSLDPWIVQAVLSGRLIRWMVAQLPHQPAPVAWLLRQGETIGIRPDGHDIGAVKKAIQLAAAGRLVGILPEGDVNTTDQFMLPVRPGAVQVALRARVPIVPCYIQGAPYHKVPWRPIFMRAHAKLKVAPPIDIAPYYAERRDPELAKRLMLQCVRAIAHLAGRDDFEPEIAGNDWKGWSQPVG